jgi:Ca-activated chloride channel family protein
MEFTDNVHDLVAALSTPYANGRTALYDAIAVGLTRLQNDPLEKKVLLLISDGGDNASSRTFVQVLNEARTANVAIYAIGLLDEHSADQNPAILKRLAKDTGGQAYFPDSLGELLRVCGEIAADIRHQYTLGYSAVGARQSGYRRIRVSVAAPRRGKLTVRTRAGYFVPLNTSSGAAVLEGRGQ